MSTVVGIQETAPCHLLGGLTPFSMHHVAICLPTIFVPQNPEVRQLSGKMGSVRRQFAKRFADWRSADPQTEKSLNLPISIYGDTALKRGEGGVPQYLYGTTIVVWCCSDPRNDINPTGRTKGYSLVYDRPRGAYWSSVGKKSKNPVASRQPPRTGAR